MPRKKRGGFNLLGSSFSRGKSGGGIGKYSWVNSRRKRGHDKSPGDGLAKRFTRGLGKKRRKAGGMADRIGAAIRDRLTPTERAEIQRETDRAIENDQDLLNRVSNNSLTPQGETFIQRLVRLVRARLH